jgi:hypothetical protein
MLTDFGLSSIFSDVVGPSSSSSGGLGCSIRWTAVELICLPSSSSSGFTLASDIYSFSSTMLEILTSQPPYPHLQRDVQVLMEIFEGGRHRREGTEEKIPRWCWEFMQGCWSDLSDARPGVGEVVRELEFFWGHQVNVEAEALR